MKKEEKRELLKELIPIVKKIKALCAGHGAGEDTLISTGKDGYISIMLQDEKCEAVSIFGYHTTFRTYTDEGEDTFEDEPLFEKGEEPCGQETDLP